MQGFEELEKVQLRILGEPGQELIEGGAGSRRHEDEYDEYDEYDDYFRLSVTV